MAPKPKRKDDAQKPPQLTNGRSYTWNSELVRCRPMTKCVVVSESEGIFYLNEFETEAGGLGWASTLYACWVRFAVTSSSLEVIDEGGYRLPGVTSTVQDPRQRIKGWVQEKLRVPSPLSRCLRCCIMCQRDTQILL